MKNNLESQTLVARPDAIVTNKQREELASRVLGFSDADQTEVLVYSDESALTRFTHESVNQNIASTDVAVSVRAIIDNRTGVARTNRHDEESLRDVVARAIALAKLAPRSEHQPVLPHSGPLAAPANSYIDATAAADPQRRATLCDDAFRVAEANGYWSAGYCATSSGGFTVANSSGARTSFDGTNAEFNIKMNAGDSTGFGEYYTTDIDALNAGAVAEIAARKARETSNPRSVDSGDWTVILEPAAFGEFLTYLLSHFSAQSFHEGSSFFSGARENPDGFSFPHSANGHTSGSESRHGSGSGHENLSGHPNIQLSENFTLLDDYAHPLSPSMPFDYEGQPTMRLPIIENGRVRNIVTDSYWAKLLDRANTGHGLPAPNAWGPYMRNAVVTPGEKSVDQLVAETKRGLLISRFWYIRTVDQKHAIVTGMTRDGTYLIENGKLVGGVRNLRFNQSILEALRHCEFSSEQRRTGSASCVVPAIKIENFHFTSTTEF